MPHELPAKGPETIRAVPNAITFSRNSFGAAVFHIYVKHDLR
jgi:hypothetical protein